MKFRFKIQYIHSKDYYSLKNVVIFIFGKNAYGLLKSEIGIHRLVRISSVESSSKRHTSFASVYIVPQYNSKISIKINSSDIKIETFKACGAGGQHVNKTNSAIRITHIPTKITTVCNSERSQSRNKIKALNLLKNKLYRLECNRIIQVKKIQNTYKTQSSFGFQIRSYILFPYKLVKDLRTAMEIKNIQYVFHGHIKTLVLAFLIWKFL